MGDDLVKQRNNLNRQFGKSAEREIAKILGGERTPMSGAVKHSNRNLTGDVEVRDNKNRDFIKLEIKTSRVLTTTGDKMFTLKKTVIDQTFREAEEAHEIGALFIHWVHGKYALDDIVIMKQDHWDNLLELARIADDTLYTVFMSEVPFTKGGSKKSVRLKKSMIDELFAAHTTYQRNIIPFVSAPWEPDAEPMVLIKSHTFIDLVWLAKEGIDLSE